MDTAYFYLALSGLLTVLLWTPYILDRVFTWGLPTFLNNYPEGFPAQQPTPPLWAQRAHRAHLNMVETMPAFIAVIIAAGYFSQSNLFVAAAADQWAMIFFFARLAHAAVYIMGIPYLRTPIYLLSWLSVLVIGGYCLF